MFVVFACSGAAQAQVINWQDHKINPASFWNVANEIAFARKVEEATGEKLKINVFPAGSSGFKDKEALDAVSENLLRSLRRAAAQVVAGKLGGGL